MYGCPASMDVVTVTITKLNTSTPHGAPYASPIIMRLGAYRAFWWGCFVLLPLFCGVNTRWLQTSFSDDAYTVVDGQVELDAHLDELDVNKARTYDVKDTNFLAMAGAYSTTPSDVAAVFLSQKTVHIS